MPTKYLRRDDLALHYLHAGATTLPDQPPALGSGATLVFLHGEGASAALWGRQVAHFAAAHSPIALDLPGHGRSSGLSGPASIADAADVVARFLRGVGAPPAVLVGHGFAGHIALELAATQPKLVRAVVTIGTAVRASIPDDAIEKLGLVVRGRLGQQFDTPFFGSTLDPSLMREFWTEMVKTDPKVRLGDLLAYRDSGIAARLARVAQPVLVIAGEADRMCPCAAAEELAQALPDARLVKIAEGGHVAHLEKAEQVNQAIERFVAERAS
jgi:pimeloyl-ACP methyl ester carboxylesterase